MSTDLPSIDDLANALDLRGLVAYACRAYQRTRVLRQLEDSEYSIAVADAVMTAELFADGRISQGEFVRRMRSLSKPLRDATQDPYFQKLVSNVVSVSEAITIAARTHIRHGTRSVAEACSQVATLSIAGLNDVQISEQVAACLRDFERIQSYSKDVFILKHLGSIWPVNEPDWAKIETCSETELSLEISVPDDVSDTDVIDALRAISIQVDDLHRALGGNGVMVQEIQVYEDANVFQGVSDG